MAHKDISPEDLALRTFVITIAGLVIYVATVFVFIL